MGSIVLPTKSEPYFSEFHWNYSIMLIQFEKTVGLVRLRLLESMYKKILQILKQQWRHFAFFYIYLISKIKKKNSEMFLDFSKF